jgi:TIR domain
MASVFVSYSRDDRNFVRRLCSALAASGHEVWLDEEEISPGTDWLEGVERGIDKSEIFAFVISPGSLASEVCRHELDHALAQRKRVLPVLCTEPDRSEIPKALARERWIVFSGERDFDAALGSFVAALEAN